jgi:hypothetical protein
LIYSVLSSALFCQTARTYLTPHKSTGGRFPRGQLAPRHQLEVVAEEEPEEVQPEAKIEEDPEEVQPEPEIEEDPEEVEQEEEPVEPPHLYDGTVLEADADGDIVIPPAPVAADDAPLRLLLLHPMLWVVIRMIQGMTAERMMKTTTMVMRILRRKEMMILAIVELSTTSTPLKMRTTSSVFYCRRYCSTWGTP